MPPDLSRLLEAAKAVHGLERAPGGTLLAGGVINHNWRVETPDGAVVVRVYPPSRRSRQVAFELEILSHLCSAGCHVPQVVSPAAGSEIPLVEGRCSVVLEHLPASPLTFEEGTAIPVESLLSLLLPIDTALDSFSPPFRPVRETRVFEQRLSPLLRQYGDAPEKRDAISRLFERLQTWEERTEIPTRVVHADIHAGNVLLREDTQLGEGDLWLIDFDDAHVSYRAIDWVLPSLEFSLRPNGKLQQERYDEILRGLSGRGKTSELDALPTLRTMMLLKFAATYAASGHRPNENPYLLHLLTNELEEWSP